MYCETLLATLVGGGVSILGSWLVLNNQKKLQDDRLAHERKKATEEWERQEVRRREERNFELKRQAYQNYLAVIAQSSRIPLKLMEFKATLALLELSGSAEVSRLASEYAKQIGLCVGQNCDASTCPYMRGLADRLAEAILSDFRSHLVK